VVPEPDVDESLSPAALRRQLARRLPAPAVPAAVVVLDAFPLSPNGKVDRRALPPAPLTSDATAPDDVPPRNEVERRLAAIWSELLGHPVPGVHASFFDLGGHSLLAARLVASINRAFDASLPLSAIYEDGGTIDAVARQLLTDDGSAGRAGRLLVSLGARASSGSEAPLLLVHPTSGSASCYLPLARALGGTVVGVQSAAFVGADDVPETIEAMARRYAAAVRAEYGGAPVRLGGWSFGGLVALETARLLEAAGIVVEQLILLDAPAPGSARTREGSVRLSFRHMLDDLAARAGTVRTLSDESLAHLSLARLEDAVRREVRRLTALGAALDDPRDDVLDDAFADRLVRACATNAAAMLRYVPEAYTIAAPVLWVLAGAEPAGVEERALWCARTVGGLETRTVADAVHATLLEPLHVDGVARIVAACATCVDEPLVGVGR
jgi:thioesterase domain-containing protein